MERFMPFDDGMAGRGAVRFAAGVWPIGLGRPGVLKRALVGACVPAVGRPKLRLPAFIAVEWFCVDGLPTWLGWRAFEVRVKLLP